MFLNAVQGLVVMVDGYGKDVLPRIVEVYLSGTGFGPWGGRGDATTMSREELDVRLRVGEALNTVVKRCGDALGLYGAPAPWNYRMNLTPVSSSGYFDTAASCDTAILAPTHNASNFSNLDSRAMCWNESTRLKLIYRGVGGYVYRADQTRERGGQKPV